MYKFLYFKNKYCKSILKNWIYICFKFNNKQFNNQKLIYANLYNSIIFYY